jgi:hypothetical protein
LWSFRVFGGRDLDRTTCLAFDLAFAFAAMNPGPTPWSLEVMEEMRDEGLRATDCAFSGAKGAKDRLASDSFAFVVALALFSFLHTRTRIRVPGYHARNND